MGKNNYSTLNSTYKAYKESNTLGQSPPGWWAIINDDNSTQATVINPRESGLEPSVTCNNFSDIWSDKVGAANTKIPYYYSDTATGKLSCTTTKDPDTNVHTATITCDGDECCPGGGINGLIPVGTSFPGQVRTDNNTAQCVTNVTQPLNCGKNGTVVYNTDYDGEVCLCEGGWTNTDKSRKSPCDKRIMCNTNKWCQEGCATNETKCHSQISVTCAGCDWCDRTKICDGGSTGIDRTGGGCCGDGCSGGGAGETPICYDRNADHNAIQEQLQYRKPSNAYPCWCSNGSDKEEDMQLMVRSGEKMPKSYCPQVWQENKSFDFPADNEKIPQPLPNSNLCLDMCNGIGDVTGCTFIPFETKPPYSDNGLTTLQGPGLCYYTTKPLKTTKPVTCEKGSTKFPCNRYLSECGNKIPPICDLAKGDNCVDCANVQNAWHPYYPNTNLWNPNGSLSGYPTHLNVSLNSGYSCQGGPCRNPGNDTKNGIGCGWQNKGHNWKN